MEDARAKVAMQVSKNLLNYALLCLVLIPGASCHSQDGHTKSENKNSAPSHVAASNITDTDWELRLVQDIDEAASLDHLRCIPDGHCWSWNSVAIWLTDNSGRWRQVYSLPSGQRPPLDTIGHVSMISPQTGWFITYRGLYKTTNGGLNWDPTSGPVLNLSGEFRSVFFSDDKHGWLAGGEFRPRLPNEPVVNNAISRDLKHISVATIWQTNDGGTTWRTKQLKRRIGRFLSMEFWNGTGVAFGNAGAVFSDDGGESWKDMQALIPEQKETGDRATITGAYFMDHKYGWIFTSWFEHLFTSDGGKNWSILRSTNLDSNLEDIIPSAGAFADKDRGLLIGGGAGTGKLLKTSDGGKTWSPITASEKFYDLSLSAGRGYVLGNKGIYSVARK